MSFGEKMNDRDLSVFVHEYVHFLQDITTLYGLEGISSDFGTLTNMVSWVKSNKHSPIYVPLPETILDEITKNNRFISDSTWGESGELNNIEIIETGLRPGEKLYEELLVKTEELDKTENELIFIERDVALDHEKITSLIDELRSACMSGDDNFVKETLKKIVPTYKNPNEINDVAEKNNMMSGDVYHNLVHNA